VVLTALCNKNNNNQIKTNMKEKYYLIGWPEVQDYQEYKGFDEHSYPCIEEDGACFVEAEWADEVDKGNVSKEEL
jgi:hypothetical protein